MKALVKYEKGKAKMELREVALPEPASGEALIKIETCGICGTDLKIYDDEFIYDPPVIVGHEFSGVIVKLGNGVDEWKTGDRIVSEQHAKACGVCSYCLTGRRHFCAQKGLRDIFRMELLQSIYLSTHLFCIKYLKE